METDIAKTNDHAYLKARIAKDHTAQFDSITPVIPANALVEITNACNHRCIFCASPRMNRKRGILDIALYEKFLDEAIMQGLQEVGLYSTGESFLVKDLDRYIALTKSKGIGHIYISTNGALASPERVIPAIEAGLTSIKFSVNAASRENYRLTHGKDDFDKVIDNIKFVSDYRKEHNINLKLLVTYVATKFTEGEKETIHDILGSYVDEIMIFDVHPQAGQALMLLDEIQCASLRKDTRQHNAKPGPCPYLWNRLHLSCEGYLTFCCVDYEIALTFADLNTTPLKEAWHNHLAQEMRQRHKDGNLKGTLCQNCLHKTQEPVFPISRIGHEDTTKTIASDNPHGTRSINERIREFTVKKGWNNGH